MAAEELTLKNGQKIVGSIVGFENDMFRVQTEFGFALVRKESVASINLGAGSGNSAVPTRGELPTGSARAKSAAGRTEKSSGPGEAGTPLVAGPASGSKPPVIPAPSLRGAPGSQPPPTGVSRPVDEPLPPRIEERVEGNNYINDTFHFAMFKPPGWKIYEGVPGETGSAIVAMGSEDEQTVLVVDRQVWSGTPDLKDDRAEANLRSTYQDYQKLSESPFELDGQPALRRVFKGVLDGVEWHGVSTRLAHGSTVFGILGLTSDEMIEFQEAVLNKIIKSFHFLNSTSGSPPSPRASRMPGLP